MKRPVHIQPLKGFAAGLLVLSLLCLCHKTHAQCQANFGYEVTGLVVEFSDSSTGAQNYHWNFADGTVSYQAKPIHAYANEGVYPVEMVVIGLAGCRDTIVKKVVVCTDCIYPGDANRDQKVTNRDVLAVGLAYGELGPGRNDTSTAFAPTATAGWFTNIGNASPFATVNAKHADCDGNGIVDANDLRVIARNYGKSYNKTGWIACNNINNIPIYFDIVEDSIAVGSAVTIAIKLGTGAIPAEDVYGIAYSILFDADLVKDTGLTVNYDPSLLGPPDTLIHLTQHFPLNGSVETAVCRINHLNITFSGTIGTVSFVMEDNLAQKNTLYDYLHLNFEDVYLIGNDGNPIPVCAYGDSVLIYQEFAGTGKGLDLEQVQVYPNPAKGKLFLENTSDLERITITNLLGQTVMEQQGPFNNITTIETTDLNGVYLIGLWGHNSFVTHKVLIQNKL